ncbi:MAG: DoxX family protein [Acidobacteriota bacterium]|nr:DoxX family protein [Acidobacteriota bacterium]
MVHRLDYDTTELIFRILFSLIFLGLGMEHLFADALIRDMMPDWLEYKRPVSLLAGVVLLSGGCSVLLGYRTATGAIVLGCFLLVVTLVIHLPALWQVPAELSAEWTWLWEVYQRSNLVKNLCLLGVCFHLINHRPGRFSLDARLGLDEEEP